MRRTEGKLTIYLIRSDVWTDQGLERTNEYVVSSRLCELGDVSDAAIFRSRESAEKAIRQMGRHSREHGIRGLRGKQFHVEEHEVHVDTSPYIPYG